MQPICLHDKNEIEAILRHNVFLHLYEIGDLDDFFWPYTTWYTSKKKGIKPILLLYSGLTLPTLLGLTDESSNSMRELIRLTMHLLPKRFYAHLSKGFSNLFEKEYRVQSHGIYDKMGLMDYSRLQTIDTSEVIPLSEANLPELKRLYRASYPEHHFEPRMLHIGYYFGIQRNSNLVSAAGVHVFSPTYKVAALGNIVTHPDFRGQGLAKAACAKLCLSLSQTVDHIGLNVKADNASAIVCYENLGFERVASYEECLLER